MVAVVEDAEVIMSVRGRVRLGDSDISKGHGHEGDCDVDRGRCRGRGGKR